MLKKILIGILIFIIIAGSVAFYAFKKLEAQFENYIMAEVERQQTAIEKELQIKLDAAAVEKEKAAEIVTIKLEAERAALIIKSYFENNRSQYPDSPQVYIGTEALNTEISTSEESSNNDISIEATNENTTTNNQNNNTSSQVDNTPSETTQNEETEVIAVVEAEEEVVTDPVEVYTKEDFEKDKKVAMDLAMSRLTASQISRLIDISSGGFSPEERVEAKEMFYSNFSDAEQNWILEIYTKYYYLASEE